MDPNLEHDDSDTEEDPARLLNQWLGELNTLKRVSIIKYHHICLFI
jgi:hypothetical protein